MAGAQPTATRPNILILMVDQLGATALPGYGHPLVKSPNIDYRGTRSYHEAEERDLLQP